eukprot:779444-Pyramimonas_sp.AAC.1
MAAHMAARLSGRCPGWDRAPPGRSRRGASQAPVLWRRGEGAVATRKRGVAADSRRTGIVKNYL